MSNNKQIKGYGHNEKVLCKLISKEPVLNSYNVEIVGSSLRGKLLLRDNDPKTEDIEKAFLENELIFLYFDKLSEDGEMIFCSEDISQEPKKKDKQAKRCIGIVKFFDSSKDFGFIVTNSKGLSGKPEDENRLFSLYINSSKWKSSGYPKDGEWVIFTPRKNKSGKWDALDTEHLEVNRENLSLAMKYRGVYARIKGRDSHSFDTYDENILCHFVRLMTSKNEVISSFCDYVAKQQDVHRANIVTQFLSDKDLSEKLLPLLTDENKPLEEEARKAFSLFSDSIIGAILDNADFSSLQSLPQQIRIEDYPDKVLPILMKMTINYANYFEMRKFNSFIELHPSLVQPNLIPQDSQSIFLRLALYSKFQDDSYFYDWEPNWEEFRNLSTKMIGTNALTFARTYYCKRNAEFVKIHPFADYISPDLACKFIKDHLETHGEFIKSLVEYNADKHLEVIEEYLNANQSIEYCLPKLSYYLSELVEDSGERVHAFLTTCIDNNISLETLFSSDNHYSDSLYAELFILTGNSGYLDEMDDFDSCNVWLAKQKESDIITFINYFGKLIEKEKEDDPFIESLGDDVLTKAIKTLNTDDQYKLITRFFPSSLATRIVADNFADSELFDLFIGDQWKAVKRGVSYVVFDLETDGDSINEFAYRTEERTDEYFDEQQIGNLVDAINDKEIVVGHKIETHDLKTLKDKGYEIHAREWDTLKIEILLNPVRYSYALHTTHHAKDDAELNDRLFWNQLYRLASDESLCEQISDFLPENIKDVLSPLRNPIYKKFFSRSANSVNPFFQQLKELDSDLIEKLKNIESETNGESCLIIAPERIWKSIAQYLPVAFDRNSAGIDYLPLSVDKLNSNPLDDNLIQTTLKRFIDLSVTPVVANIAQYIRASYLDDALLSKYVEEQEHPIHCSDLRILDDIEHIKEYKHIYFVGCELENRLNQFRLDGKLSPSDFWQSGSAIPMRMGGSSYSPVSTEERSCSLFADVPQDAANVWVERDRFGKYSVNYNYNIQQKIKDAKEKLGEELVVHENLSWNTTQTDKRNISLVRSGHAPKFDFAQNRVGSTSPYRATYWMYQLALLSDVHKIACSLPIVYIVDDNLEIDKLEDYSRSLGFYVPTDGTLFRKLELITERSHGMVIITQEQFFDLVERQLDSPYCYVWDQMAVEKHMMMLRGLNAIGQNILDDDIHESGKEVQTGENKDTYQSILLSIWPIYEYYHQFVVANNPSSKMFVMDSFLDDYHSLGSIWETSSFVSSSLWADSESFNKTLASAQEFFPDQKSDEIPQDPNAIQDAMNIILSTLVKTEKVPNPEWSPIQSKVLPEILSRKENYLISLPTGGGKSVLFQGPALYNSSYTNRLSIVVTPLKALMQDQVKELGEKGFVTNVDYLNGDRSYQETRSIYRKLNGGEIALLYVTPERFRSRSFLNALMTRMTHDKGLEYMIFDEAHCISQWGMEFRPEYLNVVKQCQEFCKTFTQGMCIAMFSATVTEMIYKQINEAVPVKRLGQDNDRVIYNPIRSHIGMSCLRVEHSVVSRIKEIVNYITKNEIDFEISRMLIFCKTRHECEELAVALPGQLSQNGIIPETSAVERVGFFHAGMEAEDREDTYARFKSEENPIYILCATKAFGMGMDIPNIHYIVHLSPPSVLEDYLQEVGRAGRNRKMYQDAGFSEESPIPTMCLYSQEDIKNARTQLLQNQLSWKNLEDIRKEIVSYIENIQSIECTKEYPIVIPNNLWKNGPHDNEYTDFKIGEYWLERLGRIKMGFLSPAHIVISVHSGNITDSPALKGRFASDIQNVVSLLGKMSAEKGEKIQVSIQGLARDCNIHPTKLLNILILCVKYDLITIEQEVRCRIAFTRKDETDYLLKPRVNSLFGYSSDNDVEVAFHIIFRTVRELLEQGKLKIERSYSSTQLLNILKSSAQCLEKDIKTVIRTNDQGQEEKHYYMPWYKTDDRDQNKGLSIAAHYKKDLFGKRFRQIFTLLDIIPDVECKSYIDSDTRTVKQSILIEKTTWRDFLPEFEKDCIRALKRIHSHGINRVKTIRWAEEINELGLEDKGYNYYESILRYLSGMAYIATDNLIPTGVEVYATDDILRPLADNPEENDVDKEHKLAFDETINIRTLRLYVMDAMTSKITTNQQRQELISAYFSKSDASGFIELLSNYYAENDPIWDAIRKKAFEDAENKMKGNAEQWAIYTADSDSNVNVEAGPGSGKTHVLTMKCARLIFQQGVMPSQILVLAYNRAVVVELKSRLAKLFASLGLNQSASRINVFTFSGFAKRVLGEQGTRNLDLKEWEKSLLKTVKDYPERVSNLFPDIRYVFIDEFQDINQTRLDAMFGLTKLYDPLYFFTIGDKDQSIYGFEKEESTDPQYYYNQLYKVLKSNKMTMSTNYRSYPKILTEAARFLPQGSKIPQPCPEKVKNEPQAPYTYIYYRQGDWATDLLNNLLYLQQQKMEDVAVFFRTNSEVYLGYSRIKAMNLPNVRIRIQGASECELFRMREIYFILNYLEKNSNRIVELKNDLTKQQIRNYVIKCMKGYPSWDIFYMDFAYTIVLDFLTFAATEDVSYTWGEMAEFIKDSLAEDNPQLYKIYETYADERLLPNKQMNVILTTMHKVKGLEFDAVIVTPSYASLPFDPRGQVDTTIPLTKDGKEAIEEERRLLYVAYTRAKKFLMSYLYDREDAILKMKKYPGIDASLGIREKEPGLDNYNIGFNASYNFRANSKIAVYVGKNEPVSIVRKDGVSKTGKSFHVFNIECHGMVVGQLSSTSNITKEMDSNGLPILDGLFVSDVFYWTHQDSVDADTRNRQNGKATDFASGWCEDAKIQGYIFIVSIAGYGKIKKAE